MTAKCDLFERNVYRTGNVTKIMLNKLTRIFSQVEVIDLDLKGLLL